MRIQKKINEEWKWLIGVIIASIFYIGITNFPNLKNFIPIVNKNYERSKNNISNLLIEAQTAIGIDSQKAYALADSAYRISELLGYYKGMAEAAYCKGWIEINDSQYQEYGEIASAEIYHSIENYIKIKDTLGIARSFELLASYHFYYGRQDSSKFYLGEASNYGKSIHSTIDSLRFIAELNNSSGNILGLGNGDYNAAIKYYRRGLNYFSHIANSEGIARSSFNLAGSFRYLNEYDSAYFYIDNAIAIYSKLGWNRDLAISISEKGNILVQEYYSERKKENFSSGLSYFNKAITLDKARTCECNYYKGKAFHYRIFAEPEFQASYDSTLKYYEKAIVSASQERDFSCLNKLSNNLRNFCEGDLDCSHLLPLIIETSDSIIQEGKSYLTEANQVIFNLKKRELRKQIEQNKIRSNRSMWILGVFLVTVAALFYQRQRIFFLRRQLQMRIEKLQAQMNPHFISNCLSAIESLIISDKRKEARQYLIKFSRLCRMILDHSNSTQITLEQELAALEHYLALEKLRMDDKLTYQMEIDESISQKSTLVPPSFIQPFVENAIWHGIQHKSDPGHLRIKLTKKGNEKAKEQLISTIEDNGIGREMSGKLQRKSILNLRKSMGMSITTERIRATGKDSSLHIEDLKDLNGEAKGTRVIITIPIEY